MQVTQCRIEFCRKSKYTDRIPPEHAINKIACFAGVEPWLWDAVQAERRGRALVFAQRLVATDPLTGIVVAVAGGGIRESQD